MTPAAGQKICIIPGPCLGLSNRRGSTLELHVYSDCFNNFFEDLIFVDDKLPAKKAKIMSLENLYEHGIYQNCPGGIP